MVKTDETIKIKKRPIKSWKEIKFLIRQKVLKIKEMKTRGEWPPGPGKERDLGELYPWNMEFCRASYEEEFKENNWCDYCSLQDFCDRDKLRAAVNKRHAEERLSARDNIRH